MAWAGESFSSEGLETNPAELLEAIVSKDSLGKDMQCIKGNLAGVGGVGLSSLCTMKNMSIEIAVIISWVWRPMLEVSVWEG